MKFSPISRLKGELTIPGDKSISHRSIMFGSIARGTTEITGFLQGADCLATIDCFQKMGVSIENTGSRVLVHGNGLHGLKAPREVLDCKNSGTTTRLLAGILAGQSFSSTLTGDASIQKRPMKRIIDPLSMMGASIQSAAGNGCAPLNIQGSPLHGIHYFSPVASAQVKSAVLLAGLYAEGTTTVTEPCLSRNHSELMLRHFGAKVQTEGTSAVICPPNELYACPVDVPGDISSAAFFLAAGLLIPHSEILIRHVGINPTRDGILTIARAMGGDISLENIKNDSGEAVADIRVRHSSLHGTEIGGSIIPSLIDELPVLAMMACFAQGKTVIRDASELKVKESNRIAVMAHSLAAMGAEVSETEDGMIIQGGKPLHGALIDSHLDHRIAMTFAIAGLCADGETEVQGAECVNISYPNFYQDLENLTER